MNVIDPFYFILNLEFIYMCHREFKRILSYPTSEGVAKMEYQLCFKMDEHIFKKTCTH